MPTYKLGIKTDGTVVVCANADTLPGGTTSLGTFVHDDSVATDALKNSGLTHIILDHVKDILSRRSAADPSSATVATYPKNIWNHDRLTVEFSGKGIQVQRLVVNAPKDLQVGGGTKSLVVSAQPLNEVLTTGFTCSSSATAVATVTNPGVITPVAEGETHITVTHTATGLKATVKVKVAAAAPPEEG